LLGEPLDGVVVIDKPTGPTSHDVVAHVRKLLDTHAVGHAGTLDPAASGVLVVAVGQATKLANYLTQQNKSYLATVAFGVSTSTLDREGEIVDEAPLSEALADALGLGSSSPLLAHALDVERRRKAQVPPAFSAIKQGGRAVHRRARRGEEVVLAPRDVEVKSLAIVTTESSALSLSLIVSKGYYVRALARDLGETLGVPAHLSSLRRTASGPFTIDEALPLAASRDDLRRALVPLARAALRVLPRADLSEEGVRFARHGKKLAAEHFAEPPPADVAAWFGPNGELVAVGRACADDAFAVVRGFG
jgi:tRNA pseudouridine55 synthase